MVVTGFVEKHSVCLARALVLASIAFVGWWLADYGSTLPTSIEESPEFFDRKLYQQIAAQVLGGDSYHHAAAAAHRTHGYPLEPWVTVRLPTLTYVIAWLGTSGSALLMKVLVWGGMIAWPVALHRAGYHPLEVLGSAVAVLGGGFIVFYDHIFLHELWAGAFLSLAFAVYRPDRAIFAIVLAVIACAFREFAVVVLAAGFAWAVLDGRRIEAAQWFVAGTLVAAFYAWHAFQVIGVRIESDEVSHGWSGMIGPLRAVYSVVAHSIFRAPGFAIGGTLLIVSVFGWFAARDRAWLAASFAVAWIAIMALFSRPENYYWSQILLPWLPIGLVLAPRAALRALRFGTRRPS